MSTTVKYFHSEMLGAPVLNGVAGSLISVLDACLVDGFGLKSATSLVVAGGVATLTFATAHAFETDAITLVAGATPGGLNGEQRVIATTSLTVSFATGLADQTATGTITSKLAPAGFAKEFTGTNLAVYRSANVAGTRMRLRVDDTGTTNARVVGYESMSDVNTGLAASPMPTQVAGGLWWSKSGTGNATARPWSIVADSRGVYLSVAPQGGVRHTLFYSGDIASLKSGDAYGYLLTGNQSDQVAATAVADGCCGFSHRSARGGAYVARSHTGIGKAIAAQRIGSHHTGTVSDSYAGAAGYAWGVYPNGPNNGLLVGALELVSLGVRGTMPGLSHPVQDCGTAFATGSVVDGTDDFTGRRLLALQVAPPSGSAVGGVVFFNLTGPWVQ